MRVELELGEQGLAEERSLDIEKAEFLMLDVSSFFVIYMLALSGVERYALHSRKGNRVVYDSA